MTPSVIFASLFGFTVAATIVLLIKSDKINANSGVGWIAVAIVFCSLGFAPSIFDRLAIFIGIHYPPTLAFTLAIGSIVLKLLIDDIRYTRLSVRHQRLLQRLALLETEIKLNKLELESRVVSKKSVE